MIDFKIADYKYSDYTQLIELWELTGLGNAARGDDNKIIEHSISLGGKLLVMKKSGTNQMIGCSWMTTDGRRLYIHHFGIHPDFQGLGLSKPLMEATMNFAKKLGQQVKLEVHADNKRAINLYKQFNFKYLGDYHVFINREIQFINKN